jgi:antitoxin VapB
VSLNIKDPEAHRLAAAISKETGESMTRVVVEALRDRFSEIERRRDRATADELLAIAKRAGAKPGRRYRNHAVLLYDRHGLPK